MMERGQLAHAWKMMERGQPARAQEEANYVNDIRN